MILLHDGTCGWGLFKSKDLALILFAAVHVKLKGSIALSESGTMFGSGFFLRNFYPRMACLCNRASPGEVDAFHRHVWKQTKVRNLLNLPLLRDHFSDTKLHGKFRLEEAAFQPENDRTDGSSNSRKDEWKLGRLFSKGAFGVAMA